MPATNYTPIQLYRSTTSGNIPSAANLSAGEIALNIADNDMTMYMENASGTVKSFFNNPAALKYPTADGTSGQIIQTNGAGVLSFASAPSSALTNNTRQAVTSSATTTINLNSGNVIDLTMAANITTLSFTNVPASGTPILVQIVVKNDPGGTAYTITWPNSVYWSGQYAATNNFTNQVAPSLATGANGVTVIALLTTDGGTKWRGWVEAIITGGTQRVLIYSNNSSPTQVSSSVFPLYTDVSVWSGPDYPYFNGGHVLYIDSSGRLWGVGANNGGQLGTGNLNYASSPVQIGSNTNWASVCTNSNGTTLALTTAGTMFSWGYGAFGILGQNILASTSSPVQIGALTTWSKISLSGYHSAGAIKTDNTLWMWGLNNDGQIGDNTAITRSSPVQIGTGWAEVGVNATFTIAVKTSGQLWVWGRNNYNQLPLGDTTSRSSPVQVGALTTWSKPSVSNYSNSGGIDGSGGCVKTDGTLWVWGYAYFGQLGINGIGGPFNGISSPVQLGSATNWHSAYFTYGNGFFRTTSGDVYAAGLNGSGQLMNSDTANRSSPIQIPGSNYTFSTNGSGGALLLQSSTSSPA